MIDTPGWVSPGDLSFVIDHLSFVIFKKFADFAMTLDGRNKSFNQQSEIGNKRVFV